MMHSIAQQRIKDFIEELGTFGINTTHETIQSVINLLGDIYVKQQAEVTNLNSAEILITTLLGMDFEDPFWKFINDTHNSGFLNYNNPIVEKATAWLAKEKGFRKATAYTACDRFYKSSIIRTYPYNKADYDYMAYAATQDELVRWLRRRHEIHIQVTAGNYCDWHYSIQDAQCDPENLIIRNWNIENKDHGFLNYETALEFAIYDCLILI